MNCISKDKLQCSVDNVFMTGEENGNFGADIKLPASFNTTAAPNARQQLYNNMRYSGNRIFNVNGDEDVDLDDLFNDLTGKSDEDRVNEYKFEDGDDGKYIDEADKVDGYPWKVITPGGRRL